MLNSNPADRPSIQTIMDDFENSIIYDSPLKKGFTITAKNSLKESSESDEFKENFFTLSTKSIKDSKEYTILVYQWYAF